jgi:hypothetical protein
VGEEKKEKRVALANRQQTRQEGEHKVAMPSAGARKNLALALPLDPAVPMRQPPPANKRKAAANFSLVRDFLVSSLFF